MPDPMSFPLFSFSTLFDLSSEGGMRTHYGMGSATAIRLAVLEGLLLTNKRRIDRAELVSLSKRGGTSGIGVNVYFDGGFVFDLGVKSPTVGFRPSAKVQNPKAPLLLSRCEMPNWKVGLCIPKNAKPKTQEDEAEFFEKACPIVSSESYRVLYHCLFGAYASVRDCIGCLWRHSQHVSIIQNHGKRRNVP
jgi:beta-ribofuranosylaminobenzene 5'-phosphate synthase